MAGTLEDVCDVMNALKDKGRSCNPFACCAGDMQSICLIYICICNLQCIFTCAGEWSKNKFSNRDIIRLQLACEVMDLDARQSIYFAALNALGEKGVNTHM